MTDGGSGQRGAPPPDVAVPLRGASVSRFQEVLLLLEREREAPGSVSVDDVAHAATLLRDLADRLRRIRERGGLYGGIQAGPELEALLGRLQEGP